VCVKRVKGGREKKEEKKHTEKERERERDGTERQRPREKRLTENDGFFLLDWTGARPTGHRFASSIGIALSN